MMDRPFLLSALFSFGIHGALVSFFMPSFPKVSSERYQAIEVAWEKSAPSSPPASGPQKKVLERKENTRPKNIYKASLTSRAPLPPDDPPGFGDDTRGSSRKEQNGDKIQLSQRKAYHPLPEYPWVSRKHRQEGIVSLKVQTDAEGHVMEATLAQSSGHALLDKAALDAIKQWVFSEGKLQKTLSIAFRLKG